MFLCRYHVISERIEMNVCNNETKLNLKYNNNKNIFSCYYMKNIVTINFSHYYRILTVNTAQYVILFCVCCPRPPGVAAAAFSEHLIVLEEKTCQSSLIVEETTAQPRAASLPLITADKKQGVKGWRAATDSVTNCCLFTGRRAGRWRVCLLIQV